MHRSPDGFIAFGVDRDAILVENGYKVWEVGKTPDWVLEIASPSTASVDLGIKREIYASIGVGEYWRYDASGGLYYREPLVDEYLQDGQYRRFDIQVSEDGVVWAHSPAINLDIHWGEIRLQYYDPVEGIWLLGLKEEQAARREEQAALQQERAAHQETQRRLRQVEEELRRRGQP